VTSVGQNSNIYLTVVYFFNASDFRHLWQLKTAVFLHGCLICGVLLYLCRNKLDQHTLLDGNALTFKILKATTLNVNIMNILNGI
jgi:hypothetical protein